MREHAGLLVQHFGGDRGVVELRKHTAWYLTGYPVGAQVRHRLGLVATVAQLDDELARLDPTLEAVPGAGRLRRGHTNGPIAVALPDGYLDDLEDATPPDEADVLALSGG